MFNIKIIIKALSVFVASAILLVTWTVSAYAANQFGYSPQLQKKLQRAVKAKGINYQPRTENLRKNGKPRYTNRLILEDSPYLIQHAHNPVDWFPWGPEAFEKAKKEGKPIFLSVGYSTCHWCHVMERESFDNPEIAKILNQNFISIKVDRERRPDVDNTYMTAVMMINGRGGWPMSSFLTLEAKTFYGGTYYPPQQFKQLLTTFAGMWKNQRSELLDMAERISTAVAQSNQGEQVVGSVSYDLFDRAVTDIMERFDSVNGGFSAAPKFPNETLLLLLQRKLRTDWNQSVADAVNLTLTKMAQGGIYDQIGGGFHRYSTDDEWLVPHFEKMLYNQAHLARVYLQAYELTGNSVFQRIARQILDYVLRDMQDPVGGFYSATDADSEGKEGVFFLWNPNQIKQALNEQDSQLLIDFFGVKKQGSFEGRNILNIAVSLRDYVAKNEISQRELLSRLDRSRETLRIVRETRVHPFLDKKNVTAWNAMMITTLAMAADSFRDQRYMDAAIRAAKFILANNRSGSGELLRVYFNGRSTIPAKQDDYAFLAEALIKLYDVTGDKVWLSEAEATVDNMVKWFWDDSSGGFYMNQSQGRLMVRPKDSMDGAIPSGNSVALAALAKLSRRTDKNHYRQIVKKSLSLFSKQIESSPSSYSYMLLGAMNLLYGESGARQFAANGNIRINSRVTTLSDYSQKLIIDLDIAPGWHINSEKPLQKDLISTTVTLSADDDWKMPSVSFPGAVVKRLGIGQEPMALYQGKVQLIADLKRKRSKRVIVPVELQLQACSEKVCLLPETLTLGISTISQRNLNSPLVPTKVAE